MRKADKEGLMCKADKEAIGDALWLKTNSNKMPKPEFDINAVYILVVDHYHTGCHGHSGQNLETIAKSMLTSSNANNK